MLNLSNNNLTHDVMDVLVNCLMCNQTLQHVDLSYNHLTEGSVVRALECHRYRGPMETVLDFSFNNIDGCGLFVKYFHEHGVDNLKIVYNTNGDAEMVELKKEFYEEEDPFATSMHGNDHEDVLAESLVESEEEMDSLFVGSEVRDVEVLDGLEGGSEVEEIADELEDEIVNAFLTSIQQPSALNSLNIKDDTAAVELKQKSDVIVATSGEDNAMSVNNRPVQDHAHNLDHVKSFTKLRKECMRRRPDMAPSFADMLKSRTLEKTTHHNTSTDTTAVPQSIYDAFFSPLDPSSNNDSAATGEMVPSLPIRPSLSGSFLRTNTSNNLFKTTTMTQSMDEKKMPSLTSRSNSLTSQNSPRRVGYLNDVEQNFQNKGMHSFRLDTVDDVRLDLVSNGDVVLYEKGKEEEVTSLAVYNVKSDGMTFKQIRRNTVSMGMEGRSDLDVTFSTDSQLLIFMHLVNLLKNSK